jgi:DNA-binding beta-propeller fold protein YncE
LIGSIFFPTYAQPVIKRLSVDNPVGIVLDLKGNVYVIETDNDRILKFNNNGTLITMWGSSGSGPGQFYTPIGIDEDESKQNVYVTDIGNNRVERSPAMVYLLSNVVLLAMVTANSTTQLA